MDGEMRDDKNDLAYIFTSELAQRVVDEVTPRLAHNVNLMDRKGRIIGSADPSRIGTLHEGALKSIVSRRRVIVPADSETSETRPGINLPLIIDDQIIGAVGITGDPVDVESVVDVLTLTVELLVRTEQLRDSARWKESAVRDVLVGLTAGTVTETRLITALRNIGAPMTPPWNLTAAIPATGSEPTRSPAAAAALLRRARQVPNVVAAELHGAVWILGGSVTDRSFPVLQARLRSPEIRLVAGRRRASTQELAVDAGRLGNVLEHARLLPNTELIELSALDAEVAVARQSRQLLRDAVLRKLTPLTAPLRATARAFLDHDLSITATSTTLAVHRNTLVQRLDRIDHLTGLDLRRFDHAVRMRLALLAETALDDPDHT